MYKPVLSQFLSISFQVHNQMIYYIEQNEVSCI